MRPLRTRRLPFFLLLGLIGVIGQRIFTQSTLVAKTPEPLGVRVAGREVDLVWIPPMESWKQGKKDPRVGIRSGFWMHRSEVSKMLWDSVYAWGKSSGYEFEYEGKGKAPTHPVHTISWNDAAKWCNAFSEMIGRKPVYFLDFQHKNLYRSGIAPILHEMVDWSVNGARLPTELEWEHAARGGLKEKRFPWGDKPSQEQGNFCLRPKGRVTSPSDWGLHPKFFAGKQPYTSPIGSFPPNGYGLVDVSGNVWEMCWDPTFRPQQNTLRGKPLTYRMPWRALRGGSYSDDAGEVSCTSKRQYSTPFQNIGFRFVIFDDSTRKSPIR